MSQERDVTSGPAPGDTTGTDDRKPPTSQETGGGPAPGDTTGTDDRKPPTSQERELRRFFLSWDVRDVRDFAVALNDIGISWSEQFRGRRLVKALFEEGKKEAEKNFAIQREKLEAERDGARTEANLQMKRLKIERNAAKTAAKHQKKLAQQERDKIALEAQLKYANDRTRGIVLYLVVLALVLMPIFGMSRWGVPAASFAQYIAPVTAIAGTILGYWFGRNENRNDKDRA